MPSAGIGTMALAEVSLTKKAWIMPCTVPKSPRSGRRRLRGQPSNVGIEATRFRGRSIADALSTSP